MPPMDGLDQMFHNGLLLALAKVWNEASSNSNWGSKHNSQPPLHIVRCLYIGVSSDKIMLCPMSLQNLYEGKTISVRCPAEQESIWRWLRIFQDATKTTFSALSSLPGHGENSWVLDKVMAKILLGVFL